MKKCLIDILILSCFIYVTAREMKSMDNIAMHIRTLYLHTDKTAMEITAGAAFINGQYVAL